jgi:hypothetical protein
MYSGHKKAQSYWGIALGTGIPGRYVGYAPQTILSVLFSIVKPFKLTDFVSRPHRDSFSAVG